MEWIIENKHWIFSGIGVLALSIIIGLLRKKHLPNDSNSSTESASNNYNTISQYHLNQGDNVAGNKIINH